MANPYENPKLYSAIVLNGLRSPGKVKLSNYGLVFAWDVQQGVATAGAKMSLKSVPLRTFTATFDLASLEQIAAWRAFEQVVLSSVPNAGDPVALQIEHPDLAARRIDAVVLAKLGDFEHEENLRQRIAVDFQQYAPPKPKKGSPAGGGGKKANGKPDPNAAAKAELANLLNQYKESPWSR